MSDVITSSSGLLAALSLGVGSGIAVWWITALVIAVPSGDDGWRDRPPLGFRLAWPLIRVLAWYCQGTLPDRVRRALDARLLSAGLDHVLTPAQLVASQVVAGLAGILAGIAAASALEMVKGPIVAGMSVLGMFYPQIWLRDLILRRRKDLLKSLPFSLDIITLCVEAGLNFNGALRQATIKGPPGVLRQEFQRVLRDIRAGKPRVEALRAFAGRVGEPSVNNLVSGIIQAETLGMSLGPLLRTQADQRRLERFLRAEKLAMEAPVKMLLPLVAFIFPCTFVVLGFPIYIMFKDI